MVLSVTGKDPARIRQILYSGTVVFHFYRYQWEGFDAGDAELRAALAQFPDPQPSRPFAARDCALALVESGAQPVPPPREFTRAALARRRRLFRGRSAWDVLLAAAAAGPLDYTGYSYAHHADGYRLALTPESRARLAAAAAAAAPRSLQPELHALDHAAAIVFVCPRA